MSERLPPSYLNSLDARIHHCLFCHGWVFGGWRCPRCAEAVQPLPIRNQERAA